MILANHPCPNCKAILECEGVAEGELVDCPQCGKPFEVPFLKRVKTPPQMPAPVQSKRWKPSFLKVGLAFIGAFFLFSMFSSMLETPKKEPPVPLGKVYKLHGRVTQIVDGGVLLADAKQSHLTLDQLQENRGDEEYDNAAPKFEPVFVHGANASVDGEIWSGLVSEAGVMRYKTVLGASKSVNAYRVARIK